MVLGSTTRGSFSPCVAHTSSPVLVCWGHYSASKIERACATQGFKVWGSRSRKSATWYVYLSPGSSAFGMDVCFSLLPSFPGFGRNIRVDGCRHVLLKFTAWMAESPRAFSNFAHVQSMLFYRLHQLTFNYNSEEFQLPGFGSRAAEPRGTQLYRYKLTDERWKKISSLLMKIGRSGTFGEQSFRPNFSEIYDCR